jgi:hypothetical protein
MNPSIVPQPHPDHALAASGFLLLPAGVLDSKGWWPLHFAFCKPDAADSFDLL